jgi:hypothetical protein
MHQEKLEKTDLPLTYRIINGGVVLIGCKLLLLMVNLCAWAPIDLGSHWMMSPINNSGKPPRGCRQA